jgi:hypothetical protein
MMAKLTRIASPLFLAAWLAACGGSLHQLSQDEGMQDLALQIALVRAIEATPDPRATASALTVLANTETPNIAAAPVEAAVREWFSWGDLSASERLLVDAVAEALAADLSAASPAQVPAVAARWRAIARTAAAAVLGV